MTKDIRARFRIDRGGFMLDVDLALPGRGVSALFGPSGSGKTTCLRAMAGLERAAGGYVALGDEVWQDEANGIFVPTHRRAVGVVFQEASLFPHLSVRANLEFGMKRVAAGERRFALEPVAAMLGITDLLGRKPDRLSGGERQRVAIARALLSSPRLLLLDEPLAALDLGRKQEILPYLERMHDELSIPIVYVSHAPDEVARLADHLVLLEAGRALASGAVGETLARTDLPTSLLEDAGVVIDGQVLGHDAEYGLLDLGLPNCGERIRLAHGPLPAGKALRIKVQARDVSLTLQRPQRSSILNLLPAMVTELAPTDTPAHLLVRLDVGGNPLLARITRYSCEQLGLRVGQGVWAQVKSVAVLA